MARPRRRPAGWLGGSVQKVKQCSVTRRGHAVWQTLSLFLGRGHAGSERKRAPSDAFSCRSSQPVALPWSHFWHTPPTTLLSEGSHRPAPRWTRP